MRVGLAARCCCAAVVGRVGGVKRGDAFEWHGPEVVRFGADFGGEVEQHLLCPCAHGVSGQ